MKLVRIAPALIGATMLLAGTAHAQAVATKTTTTRHYDCSKAGNANKAVCKNAAAPAAAAPAPAPAAASTTSASRTATVHTRTMTKMTTAAATSAGGPNGATAQCRDGTYSHSAHRSGTCSRHGGVKTWY